MKYLFLLNNSSDVWADWRELTPDEAQQRREEELPRWNALLEWMREQGIEGNGLELDDPAKARVVRVRDGETLVTDGPFTETKEAIAGLYLIDAESKERALERALRIPTVSRMGGAIEIRPLVERVER